MTNSLLLKRLIRWFTFNVVFALVPLVVLLGMRYLTGKLTGDDIAASPEVLFFALMVSATAMGDLFELIGSTDWKPSLGILGSSMLLGGALAAILYGALVSSLLYNDAIGPDAKSFRSGLLIVSLALGLVLLVVSTLTEVLIGRLEDAK